MERTSAGRFPVTEDEPFSLRSAAPARWIPQLNSFPRRLLYAADESFRVTLPEND